ncbi:asparagine synthase (glutamine-hydrolyzing) [Vibrio nereis]|uniref:asparagine synthase (glutamine-hydrolyzing) n=2 Tax=Vibrio nereis TaxID=693 RepID=A0A0M0HJJ9_VIBNE|nr:asparagine synthase (glutamine-hydrolyzing) [Vibrio nereis]KOO02245.1 asparagine synthase [Vibrio nereis]
MCGIFGHFSLGNFSPERSAIADMGNVIEHRGPDGQGIHYESKISLGNQRLAILDIEHGQQPFYSQDKNIVVVQNGEIFNHIELAEDLSRDGFECETHCDTEVILKLYERDGIQGISKLNGMFAISILDKNLKKMFLIRDRVGEKPLHYFYDEDKLVYGSEIKSILKLIDKPNVNYSAIEQYFTFNYIPSPLTIFENVFHVQPGHYLEISDSGIYEHRWWALCDLECIDKSEEEWISEFNEILDDAVRIRLRSDVPFGAFLSGGVDSSTVVGLMSRHMNQPVKTYCIGFDDKRYDESSFAQEAADRFGTEHNLKKVDPDMLELWEKVIYHCDQPHGDVSFMPTYKVAEMASKDVKMVLTGDGADELFAGYDKYKKFFTKESSYLSDEEFQNQYAQNLTLFSQSSRSRLFSTKTQDKINSEDDISLIRLKPLFNETKHMDRINQAMYIDTMLLLSGNNLVKPDRTGMAASIENRAPFLDYRMVELAFKIPGKLKLQNGETKYIYKRAVSELIGEHLAYRKKQMFTVPIGEWFKGKLKPLCEDLLFSERVTSRGFFDYEFIRKIFDDHLTGVENNTREIRALMAFEIWCRKFLD